MLRPRSLDCLPSQAREDSDTRKRKGLNIRYLTVMQLVSDFNYPISEPLRRGLKRSISRAVQTIDGVHVVAFVLLGLTLGHALLAIAEHYFPGSEGTLAGRFILGGAG